MSRKEKWKLVTIVFSDSTLSYSIFFEKHIFLHWTCVALKLIYINLVIWQLLISYISTDGTLSHVQSIFIPPKKNTKPNIFILYAKSCFCPLLKKWNRWFNVFLLFFNSLLHFRILNHFVWLWLCLRSRINKSPRVRFISLILILQIWVLVNWEAKVSIGAIKLI